MKGMDRNEFQRKKRELYNSKAWRGRGGVREIVLARDRNRCQPCARKGIVKPARDVHHKTRLGIDWSKRLDFSNCEAVCRECHYAETGREREGNSHARKIPRVLPDGTPNPKRLTGPMPLPHPWPPSSARG